MMLSVEVDNLVDVVFGLAPSSGPVGIVVDEPQDLPIHKMRLTEVKGQETFGDSEYMLQIS